RQQQGVWECGSSAGDDGQRRLPGGGRRDGELQPGGGGDGAGRAVSHHSDTGAGGGADQLRHHERGGELHDQRAAGNVDHREQQQGVRGRGSSAGDDGERHLPGGGRRDGELQPGGGGDG